MYTLNWPKWLFIMKANLECTLFNGLPLYDITDIRYYWYEYDKNWFVYYVGQRGLHVAVDFNQICFDLCNYHFQWAIKTCFCS